MSDFLRDQTGGELAGNLAYLQIDDEVQTQRMMRAMMLVFARMQPVAQQPPQPERKVIDTTDPNFIKNFKGFIRKPPTEIQQG